MDFTPHTFLLNIEFLFQNKLQEYDVKFRVPQALEIMENLENY